MSIGTIATLGIQQTRLTAATARLDFASHLTPSLDNEAVVEQYHNLIEESYRDVRKIQGLIDKAILDQINFDANLDGWPSQIQNILAELAGLDIGISDAYMLL